MNRDIWPMRTAPEGEAEPARDRERRGSHPLTRCRIFRRNNGKRDGSVDGAGEGRAMVAAWQWAHQASRSASSRPSPNTLGASPARARYSWHPARHARSSHEGADPPAEPAPPATPGRRLVCGLAPKLALPNVAWWLVNCCHPCCQPCCRPAATADGLPTDADAAPPDAAPPHATPAAPAAPAAPSSALPSGT